MAAFNATEHALAGTPLLLPFRPSDEDACAIGSIEDLAPALAINPSASMKSLLVAATARADRVQALLNIFACVDNNSHAGGLGLPANEIASILGPMQQEVQLLLGAAQRQCA